jgi:hypothetical protein
VPGQGVYVYHTGLIDEAGVRQAAATPETQAALLGAVEPKSPATTMGVSVTTPEGTRLTDKLVSPEKLEEQVQR